MKFTPYFLSVSLVLVFMAMVAVQQVQGGQEYKIVSYESGERLNQPGPKERKPVVEKLEEGNPVFLKEDLQDEVVAGAVLLTANDLVDKTEENTTDAEKDWMANRIKKESKEGSRYLVLAGSYTDNMILLSKQAQYELKDFTAEIICFDQKTTKHICLGRFEQQEAAAAFAEEAAATLDIRTYVFDKK